MLASSRMIDRITLDWSELGWVVRLGGRLNAENTLSFLVYFSFAQASKVPSVFEFILLLRHIFTFITSTSREKRN
jgi:hypothetical protein